MTEIFAKTDALISDLNTQETDLSKIVLDACELFEPLADNKGIDISHSIEPHCVINGNTSNLQRMFGNLLENALKYTRQRGKVEINLQRQGKDIFIQVSDNGIGIEPADQIRVFDRFFRCDISRSEAGCGLGLSLARAIARAHGGDISLDSKPRRGSVFTVALPG